jgi:hypothetical protein
MRRNQVRLCFREVVSVEMTHDLAAVTERENHIGLDEPLNAEVVIRVDVSKR